MTSDAVIILGIDPGLTVTGYGIICTNGNRQTLVDYGAIAPSKRFSHAERLACIYDGIADVIRDARPKEVAVEDFILGHIRAAVAVGEARAAAVLAAAKAGLPVTLYKPLEVKQFVTTYGRGSKEQVQLMVQALLHLDTPPQPADAADALAVAICHSLKRDSKLVTRNSPPSRRASSFELRVSGAGESGRGA